MICQADARHIPIASGTVQTVVTSPPYWGLRDYGIPGQMGLERTPEEYVANMVAVFREVRRVLKDDGVLWINLGDSYASDPGKGGSGTYNGRNGGGESYGRPYQAGSGRADGIVDERGQRNRDGTPKSHGLKAKDLVGIPWRVAFALQADGWYLRQDIIWSKPGPMPESVRDRCCKSHEYLFLLAKSERYYFDHIAIQEPSVTNDPRRPYTSEGAWQMDGRPPEQRHGVEPRSFKGSQFHTGKTGEHQLGRSSGKPRVSAPKGSFNGKTEAMADTGQNAFRAITESRNKRSVWTISTQPWKGAHFATMPEKLVEPCILAGSRPGDLVFDPFVGSGTVIRVASRLQRRGVGCDLNFEYLSKQAVKRMSKVQVEMQYHDLPDPSGDSALPAEA